jgi:hypothetical protein
MKTAVFEQISRFLYRIHGQDGDVSPTLSPVDGDPGVMAGQRTSKRQVLAGN